MAARTTYSSIPAHSAAASRCAQVSTAPPAPTTLTGWARSPSAPTTASSGTAAQPGRRSRSSAAATANEATSTAVITPGPLDSSLGTDRCTTPDTRFPLPASSAASPAPATTPSSDARSAHGDGSGTGGACSLYSPASARPASPPSATASAANNAQRRITVGHCPGADGAAETAALLSDAGAGRYRPM
jgi:hypothetical protein